MLFHAHQVAWTIRRMELGDVPRLVTMDTGGADWSVDALRVRLGGIGMSYQPRVWECRVAHAAPSCKQAELVQPLSVALVAVEARDSDEKLQDAPSALLGWVCAWHLHWEQQLDLMVLAVDGGARRRGIATALLCTLAASCPGARRMLLEVSAANAGARAFYDALGARELGVRRGYYRDASDALVLALPLPLPGPCEAEAGDP